MRHISQSSAGGCASIASVTGLKSVNRELVEDWAKAEAILGSFSNVEARIQTEVEWLYLLANIGKSNLAEAKNYAENLSQRPNKYQQTAQRILSGLK